MNSTTTYDSPLANPKLANHTPAQADFWQVVSDILDNPFIPPCERDGALLGLYYPQVKTVR